MSDMGEGIREHQSMDAQGCTEPTMVGEESEGVREGMHMVGGGQGRSAHGQRGSKRVGKVLERLCNHYRGCPRCWELDQVGIAHNNILAP
jgi:hypothetical protein